MKGLKTYKYSILLKQVKQFLLHKEELRKSQGDYFNIFQVLGLEYNENRTHSAFIGELLDQNGSHLMGSIFLEIFLDVVGDQMQFSTNNYSLQLEKHVGWVDIENKSGGRIDLCLTDNKGHTISIENKIDAGDQDAQIERYVNYNRDSNTVFYLTLNGDLPSESSSGKYEEGRDFWCISYKVDILKWLKLCLKETVNKPVLRETINQYIRLIEKLTRTMDSDNKEAHDLMFNEYETSAYIANNFYKIINALTESIRAEVIEQLERVFEDALVIHKGSSTDKTYSQIWMYLPSHIKKGFYFGVESFSGKGNLDGDLFVGIAGDSKQALELTFKDDDQSLYVYWKCYRRISLYKGLEVNFSNKELIKLLYFNAGQKAELANHIVKEVVKFVEYYYNQVKKALEISE
jgi:hypothetical protein